MERYAVYATCKIETPDPAARGGLRVEPVSFRVGQPTTDARAYARWERLSPTADPAAQRAIRHERRLYRPAFYEVRAVDKHGRGLGSERHATALAVPYRAVSKRATGRAWR